MSKISLRRFAGRLLALYLLFAVIGRFVERMGAVQCDCSADCWCRRPGLSTFRWVFPRGHRC
jgi:hypothetical protein